MIRQIVLSDEKKTIYNNPETDYEKLSKELLINERIICAYPNWYNIDGTLYYFKEISDMEKLINELLGPYLAQFYGLSSIQYELGYLNNKTKETGLLSKNFYLKDRRYKNLSEIGPVNVYGIVNNNCINDVLKICKTKAEKKHLMLQILKMVALDFYSHQTDRTAPNINFQVLPTISLAPLFDYSETFDIENKLEGANQYSYIRNRYYFDNKEYIYENNLFKMIFPSKEMEKMFDEYPEFYEDINDILRIDIEKYLDLIEMKYDIIIPKKLRDYYLKYDERKKEFVRKII